MSFTVVIPARYASARLPGKPLADIAGKPLIQHVYERAIQCSARQVIIATDDTRIQKVAMSFGAKVCMTSDSHRSGTERIKEVADSLQFSSNEIVVNLQGDEPLLAHQNIDQVASLLLQHTEIPVATLCTPITKINDVFDPNIVKLVKDKNALAIYFSRAPIPWDRNSFDKIYDTPNATFDPLNDEMDKNLIDHPHTYLKHMGIYAYRVSFIADYLHCSDKKLETIEGLEQLRIMENGYKILVGEAKFDPGVGVDTEKDLELVRAIMTSA